MNKDPLILIIDDEPQILRALKTILTARHFQVEMASTGEEGIALAVATLPQVIILDLTLPDMDGIKVCEEIRSWSKVPIIILSVRDGEVDKVAALDKGADDYLTKPFGIEELLARIRVALRHSQQTIGNLSSIVRVGGLSIDLVNYSVTQNGEAIHLTATEFKLLAYLASNADKVLTHRSILIHVWGDADADHIEYLRVFIGNLRKKLETDPDQPAVICTEPGIGYRFITGE
ncbi:MAG: response regulator transcription factor [Anaerolineaceae bacterium]|nr:response regulator transcription factor [Anaerolineaceae bacterium]